ncbi:DUF6745 domain-containing protein [Actinoplanes sp. NPDC049596]|uniref:DUF6745 domain-containing protein n=1 Tax=unclassified Actinoplanes TaxID=2626549 RepID=UPI003417C5C1
MQLTPAQEAMAAAIEDQWLAAALETTPADRSTAEAGVRQAYRSAGATPPERIFWLGSPRAGAAAIALLSGALPPTTSSSGVSSSAARSSAPSSAAVPTSGAASSGAQWPSWVAEVEAELRRQGWVPGELSGPSLRRRVRTEPWAAARKAVVEALGNDGWAQLSAAAGRRSWPLVMDLVAGRVRSRLSEDLATDFPGDAARPLRRAVLDAIYGQHDGTWLATFEAADRLAPSAGLLAGLTGLALVSRQTGWWWVTERFAVLTERPTTLTRDNVGRLHRGEGPAMDFPDGYGLWAWRGMPIPPGLVAELPTLTVARIQSEQNAELRRVMLEHFGYERYLREAGARDIGSDETGTLWRLDLDGDEPLVMVEVVNSTPEPDGTSRIYWLRVPPQTRTAREGVAWTFGLTSDDYHPSIQT